MEIGWWGWGWTRCQQNSEKKCGRDY